MSMEMKGTEGVNAAPCDAGSTTFWGQLGQGSSVACGAFFSVSSVSLWRKQGGLYKRPRESGAPFTARPLPSQTQTRRDTIIIIFFPFLQRAASEISWNLQLFLRVATAQ